MEKLVVEISVNGYTGMTPEKVEKALSYYFGSTVDFSVAEVTDYSPAVSDDHEKIKLGDLVRIVEVGKKDAYFGDGLEGSVGVLMSEYYRADMDDFYCANVKMKTIPEDSTYSGYENEASSHFNTFHFASVKLELVK